MSTRPPVGPRIDAGTSRKLLRSGLIARLPGHVIDVGGDPDGILALRCDGRAQVVPEHEFVSVGTLGSVLRGGGGNARALQSAIGDAAGDFKLGLMN